MTWYNGLTYEEVELAIREGRAPGSDIPYGVIEVPSGYTDWFALVRYREGHPRQSVASREIQPKQLGVTRVTYTFEEATVRDSRDRLVELRRKWQDDSELIALAKGMERTRIVGILRAKADHWDSHPVEPQLVRAAVSRALRSIADSLEGES